jgi:leucyl/phenylalanyl-tRNA--protein transferase
MKRLAASRFPVVESADEHGLLAWGGEASADFLLDAYTHGIFPWPPEEGLLYWFCPPKRAVLFPSSLKISARTSRSLRAANFSIRVNTAFDRVIVECARSKNRTGQNGTWITSDIIPGYQELHRRGLAHSIEAYRDEALVGGMYGVCLGSMFAGESMFYHEANASKACLIWLIERLAKTRHGFLDCQVMTPLLHSFGAQEVLRDTFLSYLDRSLEEKFELRSD